MLNSAIRRLPYAAVFTVVFWHSPSTSAQEDDAANTSHGPVDADTVVENEVSAPTRNADERWQVQPLIYAGVFGAIGLPAAQLGVLLDLDVGLELTDPGNTHDLKLDVRFLNDPLTVATFNFAEEGDTTTSGRILQSTRELNPSLRLRSDWSDAIRTTARVALDERWTEARSNRSRELRGEALLHAGARGFRPGPSAELGVSGSMVRYPHYRVSDRSLHNRGYRLGTQLAYSFGRPGEISAGYALGHTSYSDARYDQVDDGGVVVRADASKSYLRHTISARLLVRVARLLRASIDWETLRTNSSDYTRAIAGLTVDGADEERVIRDYFDSWRHSITLRGRLDSDERLYGSVSLELWTRVFDTYQARDEANVWLDEVRRDAGVSGVAELGVRVVRWGDNRELATSLQVLHDARRSNMRREVSFATNFAVTRILAGIELRY